MKKLFFVLLILCIGGISFAGGFSICENGKPASRVIIPKNITKAQAYAAKEFIKYIEKISGVSLPVSETPTGGNNIFIGNTEETLKYLKNFNFSSLRKDGIYIKCDGKKNLVLTGGQGSGEIYSVYTFLEDYLGVKYYLPDEEYIPQTKNISVSKTEKLYNPQFISRDSGFRNQRSSVEYALKLKQNGSGYYKIPKEYGGSIYVASHTFITLMNPAEYGKDHPEWFAVHNGVRGLTKQTAQLCLSNEEMKAELTKNVLKYIESHPDNTIYSVTQFDNQNFCECEKCSALTEKYGHSGALLTVINPIADIVKEKYPGKYLETFAYHYTREIPKGGIKPRDNVVIMLCTIEADFSKPFDHPSNKKIMKDLTDWSKVAKNLYIWDYAVGYSNHLMPFPNTGVLQKNTKILAKHKAIGFLGDGDESNFNGWLLAYKGYIIAKLSWDPNINLDREKKDFCRFYYGDAWEEMYSYINLTEKQTANSKFYLKCQMYNLECWTYEDWAEGFSLLNKALRKVGNNKKYYDRIMDDLLGYTAGAMVSGRENYLKLVSSGLMPYNNSVDLMSKYMEIAEERKTLSPEEHYNWNNHFSRNLRGEKIPPLPEEVKGLDYTEWIDMRPETFSFGFYDQNKEEIIIYDDPASSTGKTVRINGKVNSWAISQKVTYLIANPHKYADIYMTYRTEPGAPDDHAYEVGVYSNVSKYACVRHIPTSRASDGKYITEKVGTVDLDKTFYDAQFFCGGRGEGKPNPSPYMYIDRIFFVYRD